MGVVATRAHRRRAPARTIATVAIAVCLGLFALLPTRLGAQASTAELLSGQELIYRGHFGAARIYFADLARTHPHDPAAPMLEASALIWWGEAQGDESFEVDSIDVLLTDAITRAQLAADSALNDSTRAVALFWLGSSHGYRARQAEMRGRAWKAARDARAMQGALGRALALDSSCVDCLLGLGLTDYALARASTLARLAAHVLGLSGGDLTRALDRLRRASEEGVLTRTEARWVYASALLREGEKDVVLREEAVRRIAELAERFPDNPVFRRALTGSSAPSP